MNNIKILDGGMGTMLQNAGMRPGERSEIYGMQHPSILKEIHKEYLRCGSDYLYANTFCANSHKLSGTGYTVLDVITANINTAREAVLEYKKETSCMRNIKIALDVGPIGELMEPLGTLSFEDAYEIFRQMVVAGDDAGADIIIFETMSDLSELRAAVFAAHENSSLPIWATMSFEESGRSFTGTSVASFAMTMDGLPVQALGINCSLGPNEIYPFIAEIKKRTNKPVIVKPNAGLPDPLTGIYDIGAAEFAEQMKAYAKIGISYIGGCCGTTPEYIKELSNMLKCLDREACENTKDRKNPPLISGVCSAGRVVDLNNITVVGERINPTGKKRFQQALKEHDLNYIMKCALEQQNAGADILDINVGLPEIDEVAMMRDVVKSVQGITDLPLQIDSSDPAAIEAGLRIYTGKAIVNSVNGDDEKLDAILPIVKKYGAAVIGLTLDKSGLPQTAEQRYEIAKKIYERARGFGIKKEDIIIDCLTLTISSMQDQALETLKAIQMVREKLGLHCTLGVSNISFGLPMRDNVTGAFLAQALYAGLDLPIINPNITNLMDIIFSCRALMCRDESCRQYIDRFADLQLQKGKNKARPIVADQRSDMKKGVLTFEEAVINGLGEEVASFVEKMLEDEDAMDIIDKKLIPALDLVGDKYEKGTLFLPQLINAANAAGCGFEIIKKKIASQGGVQKSKGTIILATVEGDIHDIGKNIVKVVLENYGYKVIDLGRDVPPEKVVRTAIEKNVTLIGLSALMTTTVGSMKKTIEALRRSGHKCTIFVGGAVLTEEYAKAIGADYYTKDAKASADVAKMIFG